MKTPETLSSIRTSERINAVITKNQRTNGGTFDAFEYFYKLWEEDNSIFLICDNKNSNFLSKDFLNKKYILDQRVFDNIINDDIFKYSYNNVLICEMFQFPELFQNNILDAKNLYVLQNGELYFNNKNNINIRYFGENQGLNNYTFKVYYQIQRVYEHKDNIYLRFFNYNKDVLDIIKKYKNTILNEFNNFKHSKELKKFKGDFYKDFNKLIYIKNANIFDRHPRIFTECVNQNIECIYINKTEKIDNSFLRFRDRFDLNKRNINNDIVIDMFLNKKE